MGLKCLMKEQIGYMYVRADVHRTYRHEQTLYNQPYDGGGHPPLELFVWHDGAAPSCCRYSLRRSWRMCSPEATLRASPAPKPPSGRAELDVTRNAMIVAAKTTATTNLDIGIDRSRTTDPHS